MSEPRRTAALLLAASLAVPLAARAQGAGGAQMSYEAVSRSPAGAWAEYTMSMKGRTEQLKMKYAMVEKTPKQLVLEINSQTPMGPMVVRMEYEPQGSDAWKLARAKAQMGGGQVQDMPPGAAQGATITRGEDSGLVGKESVKVPAGTFDCRHYKKTTPQGTFDIWINDKVFPIGLVKMLDTRGMTVVMSGAGAGATGKLK